MMNLKISAQFARLLSATALAAFLLSCAASPVVGFATSAGVGDVRTDGDVFVAMGEIHGDAGLFLKGLGAPLTFPLDLNGNEWAAWQRSTGARRSGSLTDDPLPEWTAGLYRPDEVQALSAFLGARIKFEGVATPPPAPDVPAQ